MSAKDNLTKYVGVPGGSSAFGYCLLGFFGFAWVWLIGLGFLGGVDWLVVWWVFLFKTSQLFTYCAV